jgi:hypothetical protein
MTHVTLWELEVSTGIAPRTTSALEQFTYKSDALSRGRVYRDALKRERYVASQEYNGGWIMRHATLPTIVIDVRRVSTTK